MSNKPKITLYEAIKRSRDEKIAKNNIIKKQQEEIELLILHQGAWIKVVDKLPIDGSEVIACCDGLVKACIFRTCKDGDYYFEIQSNFSCIKADYWQPMPLPPKENE